MAKIASFAMKPSSSPNTCFLISAFSATASTTRPQPSIAWRLPAFSIRRSAASASAWVIFSLPTKRARLFSIPPTPFSRHAGETSWRTTGVPFVAKTCAIPAPIVPAPTTPTFWNVMLPSLLLDGWPLRTDSTYRSTARATALPPPRHSAANPRFASFCCIA